MKQREKGGFYFDFIFPGTLVWNKMSGADINILISFPQMSGNQLSSFPHVWPHITNPLYRLIAYQSHLLSITSPNIVKILDWA